MSWMRHNKKASDMRVSIIISKGLKDDFEKKAKESGYKFKKMPGAEDNIIYEVTISYTAELYYLGVDVGLEVARKIL